MLFQIHALTRPADILSILAEVLACRIIFDTHLVQKRFRTYLMSLETQIPRVISEHQSRHFLVGEDRDAMPVFAVSLPRRFGYHILPSVQELGASREVGDDKIRLERIHALEFLMGVGQ